MIRAFKLGGTEFEILCFEFVMYDFDQLNKYLINLCFFSWNDKNNCDDSGYFFYNRGRVRWCVLLFHTIWIWKWSKHDLFTTILTHWFGYQEFGCTELLLSWSCWGVIRKWMENSVFLGQKSIFWEYYFIFQSVVADEACCITCWTEAGCCLVMKKMMKIRCFPKKMDL